MRSPIKEKAYIIPKKSRLYTAAVICMILQFAALAVMNAFNSESHIPFFGNIVGDTHGFFVFLLINDILYFLWCVLQVLGMLLARKNLWVLSCGWLCSLLLQIWENIIFGDAGTLSFNFAACCALALILAQTGNIRTRKAAVIPFIVCGAVYLTVMLPSLFKQAEPILFLYALSGALQYFSCAMLMASLLWRNDAVRMPEPIVETVTDQN